MLVGHLALVLAGLWRCNISALFTNHEHHLTSEEAAIFEGLESLDPSIDNALGLSDELDQDHETPPKHFHTGSSFQVPPSRVASPRQTMSTTRTETVPSSQPRAVMFADIFGHQNVARITRNAPKAIQQESMEKKRGYREKTSSLLDASCAVGLQMGEPLHVSASITDTEAPGITRIHNSQGLSTASQLFRNLPCSLKRPRLEQQFACSNKSSKENMTLDQIEGHMPIDHTYSNSSNDSEQLSDIARHKKHRKEADNFQKTKFHSRKSPNNKDSTPEEIRNWRFTKQTSIKDAFPAGLLSDDSNVRIGALRSFLPEILPNFSLNGMESLEDFAGSVKTSFEEEAHSGIHFCWLWDTRAREEFFGGYEEDGMELLTTSLKNYKRDHRPDRWRPGATVKSKVQFELALQITIEAGARRLEFWGIMGEIHSFFSDMIPSLRTVAEEDGQIPRGVTKAVNNFIRQAMIATISVLYQVELLYRLSAPIMDTDYPGTMSEMKQVLENLKEFWMAFRMFKQRAEYDSKSFLKNCFLSPEAFNELKIRSVKCTRQPTGMRLARTLFSQWCLTKDLDFFDRCRYNHNNLLSYGIFYFLEDCALADLISMII